jgi:uncharacterized protein YheU (UPF0270 family)
VNDAAIRERAVEVPYTRVAADVLRRVAEEFVTRDGTDYGAAEKSLDEKVADVHRQLERGEAALVYDAESDTINIVPRGVPGIVQSMAAAIETEANMGDRSPKSKQRDQKQKDVAKASGAAAAKSKQDSQSHAPPPNLKRQK